MSQYIALPQNQIFKYVYTGKFKALSDKWKHERFPLNEFELITLTEGELYITYQDQNFHIKKNEYLLLPPSSSFRLGYKEAYSEFYWLHFISPATDLPYTITKTMINTLDCDSTLVIPQTGIIPRPEKLIVLMKQLQDLVKNHYPQVSVNTMTTCIITELYGQLQTFSTNAVPINQKQIYNDMLDYIEKNLSRNIKVQDIADAFKYNPKYLSHLFYKLCGTPLKQFILKRKIETANFMLSDKDMPIKEIAFNLGFSDVHNFTRAYKKQTGISPSEYRNAFSKRLLFHK